MHQGQIETIVGCIKVLSTISSLDKKSKKFIKGLLNSNEEIDLFICECKFMHDEKVICCKPCGTNFKNTADSNCSSSICQVIMRLAKKYGITTGYWEEMLYLNLSFEAPNRELLCSSLDKFNGKLLNSSVCDRRGNYEENYILVERWRIKLE